MLSGGEHHIQGFNGHVIGGMGSITQAMASAVRDAGAEIRTNAEVARIDVREGRATGVTLEDGTEISARTVVSNADPKRTFLGLIEKSQLDEGFRADVESIAMAGPCAKVNFALDQEPRWHGMPEDADPNQRSLATLVPTLEGAQRMYDQHRWGEIPDELWVDCVTSSNVDDTLAPPGTHVMTAFVQYVPFELRSGTWDERRDELGRKVVETISRYIRQRRHVDPGDAGRHAAGPGAHLRADRGQHLPRRPQRRAAVLHAAAPRVVPVPNADRRTVPVRGRHAPRRRRDRRARLRLVARGPEGPEAAAVVTLEIACPTCGPRPHTEFAFGGEDLPYVAPDAEADFARVFHPRNAEGPQRERWFHALGCRSWFVLTRDTRTNRIG